MSDTKEFLIRLANASSVSGFEEKVGKMTAEAFSEYCDEVRIDKLGNVIGHKKGSGKYKILFAAHIDEIGLMVTEYEEGGFLKFTNIGGYDQRALVGQEVIIHGKEEIFGVIGVKPPHITKPEEAKNAHKIEDMVIDTGFSIDKLKEKVALGDVITLKREIVALQNDNIAGKAIDDRAGVAVLYEAMKELKNVDTDIDIYYVGSVQEEIGCRGAMVAAYAIEPNIAIAIDVTHGKTPDVNDREGKKMGGGAVISIGPNISPRVYELLVKSAKDNFLPYQIDVAPRHSGTDAFTMQVSGVGAASGVVSIPLKYMHTSVETLCMKDVYLTAKLISSFVKDLCGRDLEEILCL